MVTGNIGLQVMEDFYNPKTGQYFRRGNTGVPVPEGFEGIAFGTKEANDYFSSLSNQSPKTLEGPDPTPQPQTIPASQDPSQFVQTQVGAAVRQPSLPTGTATFNTKHTNRPYRICTSTSWCCSKTT